MRTQGVLIGHRDPITGLRDIWELDCSLSLQENIELRYPDGLNHETVTLSINGQVVDPMTCAELDRKATAFDRVDLVFRQQGFDPISIAIIAAVAVAAAVAVTLLMPKPQIPNNSGERKDSPNNSLSGQTNIARTYQAIPDIYGKVRSYPDLIQPSVEEYINNRKFVTEWMCVGIGKYTIENLRFADTPLDNLPGVQYSIYQPNTKIPQIIESFPSPEVDGQELLGPNETDPTDNTASTNSMTGSVISEGVYEFIVPYSVDFQHFFDNEPQYVEFSFVGLYSIFGSVSRKMFGKIQSATFDAGLNLYTFTMLRVSGNSHSISTDPMLGIQSGSLKFIEYDSTSVGPFISQRETSGIWINIVFQQGLRRTAEFVIDVVAKDEFGDDIVGSEQQFTFSVTEKSYDPQFVTKKFTPSYGSAIYAVSVSRTNNASQSIESPDQAKLENVYFVRNRQNVNFGNVTIFTVTTRATVQATGIRERIFNADCTRHTINRLNDTLAPSRSFADAVLHQFVAVGGRDRSELDLDGLYAISDSLDDDRLGYFDFTFDDKDISLGQRIQTMCNAARVAVYRDGQLWRFVRDERRSFPSMQLDRRTLKEGSDYQVQIKGHLPSSFDGVKLEYVNPDNNVKAYINLKIDSTTGQITEQASANPYELQLAGCRDPFQAMNRAQLEARKIIYQRTTVKDTVLGDPFNQATFGSMIKWVDSYDVAVNDGEILSVESVPGGYRFLTSEPVAFEDGKSYRVTVTDDEGAVSSPAACVARPDGRFGFDSNISTWYVADDGIKQLGSRYLVTTEEEQEAAKFIVSGRTPTEEGDVQIELVEYDDRIYEYDT